MAEHRVGGRTSEQYGIDIDIDIDIDTFRFRSVRRFRNNFLAAIDRFQEVRNGARHCFGTGAQC